MRLRVHHVLQEANSENDQFYDDVATSIETVLPALVDVRDMRKLVEGCFPKQPNSVSRFISKAGMLLRYLRLTTS